jgi:hypothetical protein
VAFTLKIAHEMSPMKPYMTTRTNENGTTGRQSPVSIPPTAPTLVAPQFFKKRAPKTRKIESTTINSLSIGGGTNTLVTNIAEPKRAVNISRSALRNK